jgi:hypothetical protein
MVAVSQTRARSIRRELQGEELGDRYSSLNAATLGREAIRSLLNPTSKPASQLNALAVFAGSAPAPCDLPIRTAACLECERSVNNLLYMSTSCWRCKRDQLLIVRLPWDVMR